MSADGSPFRETINPNAFEAAIASGDVIDFYAEHNPDKLLATTSNGSLVLRVDDQGLYMEAQMLDTNDGRDTYELIKTGVITSMSFGFIVLDDSWDMDGGDFDDGVPLRTVNELFLKEVSAVRFPAYLSSSIEARGMKALKDFEKRGINNVSEIVKIKKEDNDLKLDSVETRDLLDEIERRAGKLPANEVVVKPSKRDDESQEPKVDATQTIDLDSFAAALTQSILDGVQGILTARDDEDDSSDVPEPDDSGDAPETDDASSKDNVKVPGGKGKDKEPDKEPDDKSKEKQEKRSLEAQKLLDEIGGMSDED